MRACVSQVRGVGVGRSELGYPEANLHPTTHVHLHPPAADGALSPGNGSLGEPPAEVTGQLLSGPLWRELCGGSVLGPVPSIPFLLSLPCPQGLTSPSVTVQDLGQSVAPPRWASSSLLENGQQHPGLQSRRQGVSVQGRWNKPRETAAPQPNAHVSSVSQGNFKLLLMRHHRHHHSNGDRSRRTTAGT